MNRIIFSIIILFLSVIPSYAMKLKDADIDFGIQYRVMYNNSNINSDNQYDFFRQRLRLNLDVKTEKDVGGTLQMEFRGGWGGSSPAWSDPRDAYAVSAFNRLQARGIRYGYLYFPAGTGKVTAGILPLNDQADQMLFSADWDFNVGGISFTGKNSGFDYRVAYSRLVEGVFYKKDPVKDKDQHFLIGDLNKDLGKANIGLHYYGTYGKIIKSTTTTILTPTTTTTGTTTTTTLTSTTVTTTSSETLNQTWIGPHATINLNPFALHGVALINDGKIGGESNDGWLARLEGSGKLGPVGLGLLGIYSSGDKNGDGFTTIHEIFSTGGYWAYTYIFTPHGPSDVNDFGLEPGNKGYGLTTMQGKVDIPITDKISGQVVAGIFRSNKDMVNKSGVNVGKNLGTEVGGQVAINVGKNMNLELGTSMASLGDAGKTVYNGVDKKSINEIFSRLQLEF